MAKKTLEVSSSKSKVYTESWWWNEEVQKKIKEKARDLKTL